MNRAVLDTNTVLSSQLAKSANSPNVEIVSRWLNGEFIWLHTPDILDEYAEKLIEYGVSLKQVISLLSKLRISEPSSFSRTAKVGLTTPSRT